MKNGTPANSLLLVFENSPPFICHLVLFLLTCNLDFSLRYFSKNKERKTCPGNLRFFDDSLSVSNTWKETAFF